ncbi:MULTISPECIES: HAMP domain-containing sensor histidine kinase [Pseudomonas]|uniref:sensor histidine kinase n=1 Tax=Pseudomonas TaxID=286 RepID=UPI00104451D0|nr:MULTISPECIES: ATP-binding protein [Pseudomonas]MBA1210849.1 two-component sensor histidine kinase [Pseudomonas psychrotolerans]TCQ87984.1 two-component system sensor histidine kinase QseC [Pseudomonas sp. JUb52]
MTSIRRRTVGLVLSLLLIGTLLIALTNVHDSQREIGEIYDAQLAQSARILQGMLRAASRGEGRLALHASVTQALAEANDSPYGHRYEAKMAFQAWNARGEPLMRSPSAPIFSMPTTPGFTEQTLEGEAWYGFLLPDPEHDLMLWVGEREEVRADLVRRILRHTLTPHLIGLVLLSLLAWLAIGWGLKPLRRMAGLIRHRDPESLQPLQLDPLPRELEPMQAALNRLLLQIEQLLQRERRFIADAAHELRTPLAVLRLHAQNALSAQTAAARDEALKFVVSGTDRLTRVVNQLLILARLEPRPSWSAEQRFDLRTALSATLEELGPWILDRGLDLSLDAKASQVQVHGDSAMLGIALQNLLTNAVNVSPPGGEIRVRLEVTADWAEIQILDQGPGIAEEIQPRLFERFYSSGAANGAGLGLSIVQTVAQHLGGRIELDNRPEGGACARLGLPVLPGPA